MALDPISIGLEFVGKIADKIWPDPVAKQEGLFKLEQLRQTGELAQLTAETDLMKGQLAIDTEEAKSESVFVSGWRPFIGWVCGSAFAYKFILQPFLIFGLMAAGSKFDYHTLPTLDWSELLPVLMAMLGMGGLRTYEKAKGVNK
jgi:hypothetical protein